MTVPSRAEAKRLAAQHRLQQEVPATLPEPLQRHLDNYQPRGVDRDSWAAVRAVHHDVMQRSNLRGAASFRLRCGELAAYLVWRQEQALSVAIEDAMTFAAIDDHYKRGTGHLSAKTRNDHRSRIRKLAEQANPSLAALPRAVPLGHQVIKPPYSAREEALIRLAAVRQRNIVSRRNLCAVVGLAGGAGLDSVDLRHLRRRRCLSARGAGAASERRRATIRLLREDGVAEILQQGTAHRPKAIALLAGPGHWPCRPARARLQDESASGVMGGQ